MSLGTQFLEVQYNRLLFQLQRTYLGGAHIGVTLFWCSYSTFLTLVKCHLQQGLRSQLLEPQKFSTVTTVPMSQIQDNKRSQLYGFSFLLHLYLYFGGRGDNKPGHTVEVRGQFTGQGSISGYKTGQQVYLPRDSIAKVSTLNGTSQMKPVDQYQLAVDHKHLCTMLSIIMLYIRAKNSGKS